MRCFYNQTGTSEPSVYTQYLYAGGTRIKKITRKSSGDKYITVYIDGIFEHSYHLDGSNTMDEELNELHVMDDQTRVAMLRTGHDDGTPFTKYILSDHLGSSNVILETSGAVYNLEEYYPFGETSFGSFGKKRYRYVGKEKDEESGLYYYGARYFQPWSCRFISVDPLALKYSYQSSYTYADDNPICKMDYHGMGTNSGPGGGGTQYFSADESGVTLNYDTTKPAANGTENTKSTINIQIIDAPDEPELPESKIDEYRNSNRIEEADQLAKDWTNYKKSKSEYDKALPLLNQMKERLINATPETDKALYDLRVELEGQGNDIVILLAYSNGALSENGKRVFAHTEALTDTKYQITFDFNYIAEAQAADPQKKYFYTNVTRMLDNLKEIHRAPNTPVPEKIKIDLGGVLIHELGHVIDYIKSGPWAFSGSNPNKETLAESWEEKFYREKYPNIPTIIPKR